MDPQRPSSSGCEPAGMPKIEMVVSWYGERKRKQASFADCGCSYSFPCWWASCGLSSLLWRWLAGAAGLAARARVLTREGSCFEIVVLFSCRIMLQATRVLALWWASLVLQSIVLHIARPTLPKSSPDRDGATRRSTFLTYEQYRQIKAR